MKTNRESEWTEVIAFDTKARNLPRIKGEVFLHSKRIPMSDIDFNVKQKEFSFDQECTGFCGV